MTKRTINLYSAVLRKRQILSMASTRGARAPSAGSAVRRAFDKGLNSNMIATTPSVFDTIHAATRSDGLDVQEPALLSVGGSNLTPALLAKTCLVREYHA